MGRHSKEKFDEALEDIRRRKISIFKASKSHNIPYETLRRRWNNSRLKGKAGAETIFSKDEEKVLYQWILEMSSIGFSVSQKQFLSSVGQFAIKANKKDIFQSGVPSNNWYRIYETPYRCFFADG